MFIAAALVVFGSTTPIKALEGPMRPQVIHSFNGTDGSEPASPLVLGSDGAFYGTNSTGGFYGAGNVFRITQTGLLSVLYNFTGGADGGNPFAALTQGTDGNLYGTTYSGGVGGLGTVFRMTSAGALTTLRAFIGGPSDGARPRAALLQAGNGNFIGTTQFGGPFGRGTIFEMTPAGFVTIRYAFSGGFDGAYPYASVIQASDGNFYGTAYSGDITTFGRIYRMTPDGVVTVMHTFTSGADGANPLTPLVQGRDGNFYGTTYFGGAANQGTAFRMTPDGTVTVLHSFSGSEGIQPGSGLIQSADGSFYGTTKIGGLNYGTVFRMTEAGGVSVVYTFSGGADGSVSSAGLVMGANGKMYGTTNYGGAFNRGGVFRLPPSTIADFDADGKSEIAVFRPSTGTWFLRNVATITWGGGGDIPVAGDYDGDGNTDIAIFRPPTSSWFIRNIATVTWGGAGDIPVPGDYDGDGKTDIAVFRPSTSVWYIRNVATVTWGGVGDIPVVGDYNGDGKSDIAIFRPSTGVWYIRSIATVTWGGNADIPVVGDYDGNGTSDIAIFRPSSGVWYIRNIATLTYGGAGDIPVPGDYNGDYKTEVAVFRPSTGSWFISTSASAITWGGSGDIPIVARQ